MVAARSIAAMQMLSAFFVFALAFVGLGAQLLALGQIDDLRLFGMNISALATVGAVVNGKVGFFEFDGKDRLALIMVRRRVNRTGTAYARCAPVGLA